MENGAPFKDATESAYEAWRKTLVVIPAGDRQAFLAGWHAAMRELRRR
jgi:hypothetical protein